MLFCALFPHGGGGVFGGEGDELGEGCGLGECHVGEHFTIDHDLGLSETIDKSAVGESAGAYCRVDTVDPESAEIALLEFAADVGILSGAHPSFVGYFVGMFGAAYVAFVGAEDFVVAATGGETSFDTGHDGVG